MKIVIVGAGVSGSYLANLLDANYEFLIYDGYKQRGCRCGWGSSESLLRPKLWDVGLNLSDYWLCKPESVLLNGIRFKVRNGIMFNKPKMLKDLTKDVEVIPKYVNFNQLRQGKFTINADVIVNATGKPLLPSEICYTVQWKMALEAPEPKTVYLWFSPEKIGYAWTFPLDEEAKLFHVGAGSIYGTMEAVALTKETLRQYNFKIKKTYCGCKKTLHFGQNLPVFHDNIVSVGEAVGVCVTGLTYVLTESGWKYAFRIKKGDRIISYNLKKGTFESDQITNISKRRANKVVRITLSDGKIVETTKEHVIPVAHNTTSMVRASEIKVGDSLFVHPYTPEKYAIPANIKISRTVKKTTSNPAWRIKQSKRVKAAMIKVMNDPEKRERVLQGLEAGWKLNPAPLRGKTWDEFYGTKKANKRREKARKKLKELIKDGKMWSKGCKHTEEAKRKMLEGAYKFWCSPEYEESRERVLNTLKESSGKVKKWRREHPEEFYLGSVKGAINARKKMRKFKENIPKGQLILEEAVRKKYGDLVVAEYPIWNNRRLITIIDVAVPKLKLAFFSDGEYWHNFPKGNKKDREVNGKLRKLGWTVFRFWEKEILHRNYNIPVIAMDPEVINIEEVERKYWVYDFNVRKNHTFVANGIVLHNCHPLTGEGILPSIRSAELLAESLREPAFPMNYVYKVEEIIREYHQAFEALETLRAHRRLGMIKVIRAMTKRLKQRTQPEVDWISKMRVLLKFFR